MGSVAGQATAPGGGFYCATKFAVECLYHRTFFNTLMLTLTQQLLRH
jgi:NADP-dependent 3-hydroxy acid dehydrogenase YdfG